MLWLGSGLINEWAHPMSASRSPTELTPARMGALARLPLFFALAGKHAIVAGGAAALWKAELLAAAGATVRFFTEEPDRHLALPNDGDLPGHIEILHRAWTERDFQGTVLAVCAFDDERTIERFAGFAHAAGALVNAVDQPAYCDFTFGAIVNRSPLVVGISTDGTAPALAVAIRTRLDAMIPAGLARWTQTARTWRARLSHVSRAQRQRFWSAFARLAMAYPDRDPAEADFTALLQGDAGAGAATAIGSVTIVGAGPGDPELLTLRALRALQSADVILIDDLVSPEILDFARREAKRMLVGKTGHRPSCKQDEINALMVKLAHRGKRVVRLKGGDPLIFARLGEELAACRAVGIPVEVVPGISAAQGAASRLGISLTHRKLARRLQYVTGHAANGRLPEDIDWQALADPHATTVIYMPKRTLEELSQRAIAHGLAASTPAMAILRATQPGERLVASTIADLPGALAAEHIDGPLIVIVGHVLDDCVASRDLDGWAVSDIARDCLLPDRQTVDSVAHMPAYSRW